MTTAIIGTGGLGSAIARLLAAGGETLQLSSGEKQSAQRLAAAIGGTSVVAVDNRSALEGADAVILTLRFTVLKSVIDEIADALGDKCLIVPSNPVGLDREERWSASCRRGKRPVRLWPGGCPKGRVWSWLSGRCRLISWNPRATGHPSERFSST